MIINQISLDLLSLGYEIKPAHKIFFPEQSETIKIAVENYQNNLKKEASDPDKILNSVAFSNIEAASLMPEDLKTISSLFKKIGERSYTEMQDDSRKKIATFKSPNS